jgi:hypothetical protein
MGCQVNFDHSFSNRDRCRIRSTRKSLPAILSHRRRIKFKTMFSDLSLADSSVRSSPPFPPQPSSFPAFQKLPTELKLLICKHAVTQPKPIDLSKRSNQLPPETTLVSQLFHNEGSKLYYRENTFLLPLPSRLSREQNLHLDQWLCDASTTDICNKMGKIVVQVSLPPDRSSLANLLLLATHFSDLPSEKAKKTIKLQPFFTVPAELELIMPVTLVATELEARILRAFWSVYDGSLQSLARGTYRIDWVDEEEMEMNFGVPQLERSVALGRICEELWLAIMNVWHPDSQQ